MPEAEDVITDAARHATVFARDLWRRHRASQGDSGSIELSSVALRLDLLICAVFGRGLRLRVAQRPARSTLLTHIFKRHVFPHACSAIPATDGVCIWLPGNAGARSPDQALDYFRCMALQQAARACRGSALLVDAIDDEFTRSVYLLLEAHAADGDLARLLPGIVPSLAAHRTSALISRPLLHLFSEVRRPLEQLTRHAMTVRCDEPWPNASRFTTAADSLVYARMLAASMRDANSDTAKSGFLFLDDWTGELRSPSLSTTILERPPEPTDARGPQRSARLPRRPGIRKSREGEDEERSGAWMIQTAQPQEHAEDPVGMQRPTDRDQDTAAEEFADSVSELSEARLVSTPGSAKEILLSDDAPDKQSQVVSVREHGASLPLAYPEWDYRTQTYQTPGAIVQLCEAPLGSKEWVRRTLKEHATLVYHIRRRFESLRAERVRLKRQEDGEDIDVDAYTEAYADARAGRAMHSAVYQTQRPAKRDVAILLLIDVSGSTDGWMDAHRRVIDIEREALLLVSLALEGARDPFAVLAFSGQGPQSVTVKTLKDFAQPYSAEVAQRIAALEPENYTRVGAAIRHATTQLMQIPAQHRLLMLLSDGKPNDIDQYEGIYGIEDARQSVNEARLQGIHPFCLTIDRCAANYLPRIFGQGHYALLPRSEHLPLVLIDWLRRLIRR